MSRNRFCVVSLSHVHTMRLSLRLCEVLTLCQWIDTGIGRQGSKKNANAQYERTYMTLVAMRGRFFFNMLIRF